MFAADQIVSRAIGSLKPYAHNARTHSKRQVRQIANSIERFGFTNPVLISDDNEILAGHGRVSAARLLGLAEVPTLLLSHLSGTERRAYILADNKLALNAGWDRDLLALELQTLIDLEFDVEITGFSLAEIDFSLDEAKDRLPEGPESALDNAPSPLAVAVTQPGDIWELGRHRLLCGDARNPDQLARLLDGEIVDLVFTDPPYNVAIDGNVCGLGGIRHREFAMASGEMNESEFIDFLVDTLRPGVEACRDGAIAFVCMDWRHMVELRTAGAKLFSELKNVCVWNKTNGGMGTFYRSKHELIFVFKVGTAPHVNSFGLGETGRHRTNVWDYPGVSSIGRSRRDLELHPTVKPVALVADAIKDCSRRGAIVLDMFGGSGSTLIAAENCGRSARLIEIDTVYCAFSRKRLGHMHRHPGEKLSSKCRFTRDYQSRRRPFLQRPAKIRCADSRRKRAQIHAISRADLLRCWPFWGLMVSHEVIAARSSCAPVQPIPSEWIAPAGAMKMTETPDRILRIDAVLDRTGLSRSTLYRKIQQGTFPRQIAISERCAGWRESAVTDWLRNPVFYRTDQQ